jgi:hypothetical protein
MELREFIRLILKEDLNDVKEIIVETKNWFYHWTEGEVEIYQKEDSYITSPYITGDPPPCWSGTAYIDKNKRTVMKIE